MINTNKIIIKIILVLGILINKLNLTNKLLRKSVIVKVILNKEFRNGNIKVIMDNGKTITDIHGTNIILIKIDVIFTS